MNIGIVGYGIVGKAVADYYPKYRVWHYDTATDTPKALEELNSECELVFICVGTPYNHETGQLDCGNVVAAVGSLTGSKTVIIKSTVMPGTTDLLQEKHPEHRLFFVPEFLNEDTAVEDYAHPRRRHVIGVPIGNDGHLTTLSEVLPRFKHPGCNLDNAATVLPAKQAELLKLATNAFYALKVMFANTMYDAGMTQETLDALGEDNWIYPYHLQVEHKGKRGAFGACLPKDSQALASFTHSPLFEVMTEYNNTLLESQGLKPMEYTKS